MSSDRILDLHVADIACGSGALLVVVARFLARELVEAWTREGALQRGMRPADLERQALRKVVARYFYGVDIDEMAVEMCKLSLWLVSLDKDKPFGFVDDKVLVGNSLLGLTDLRQLKIQHIDLAAATAQQLFELDRTGAYVGALDVDTVVKRATDRRQDLVNEVSSTDPARSTTIKQRLQHKNEEDLKPLTRVADVIVAADPNPKIGAKSGQRLNEAYNDLAAALGRAFPTEGVGDDSMFEATSEQGLTPTVPIDCKRWHCLHWPLAMPEVMGRGGFDAIAGNPSFLGGNKLTDVLRVNIRDWFVEYLAGGRKESADLMVYFFLHAFSLFNERGTMGPIATNAVAQGDTHEVGSDQMTDSDFIAIRAVQSHPWPSRNANFELVAVWGTRYVVSPRVTMVCDGESIPRISTPLEPADRVEGKPECLAEDARMAFIDCYVLRKGFILGLEEVREWIVGDPRNAEAFLPYLNGENLNSRSDCFPSRWVVDFNTRSEVEVLNYLLPCRRVQELVFPERRKNNRKVYRDYWRQHREKRLAVWKVTAGLNEVLIIAPVSKTFMSVGVPTGQVFSHALGVFATDSYAQQAVLSSSLHQCWVIAYGSGMRSDPRYTSSNVFETFPRPEPTSKLEAIDRTLNTERHEIILHRELGLTRLYNPVNDPGPEAGIDPDIDRMRAIHVELDVAIVAAYGWEDLDLTRGFRTYQEMTRWTASPATRVEFLDRLLEENHRRVATEAPAAASGQSTGGSRPRRGRKSASSARTQEVTLDI